MGRHKAHAKFDRAEWRLRFLIPLWILQTILAVVMLGVFGSQLRKTIEDWQEENKDGKKGFPTFTVVWESVNLALGAVAPVLVFSEMFMFFEETLTPRRMMLTQFITLSVAFTALVLDIFAHVEQISTGIYSILALAIGSVFIITSVIPMLYAFRNHRRLAAYDELMGPTNTKLYGFNDLESHHLHPYRGSMMSALSDGTSPRRLSAASLLSIRRLSAMSAPSPPEEVPLQEQGPTTMYNHERDTQFDEYVSARHPNVRDSVDRAMRAEFGWGRSGSPASLGDDLGYKGVLGARGDMARVPSSAGHSLDAVPETVEGSIKSLDSVKASQRAGAQGSKRSTGSGGSKGSGGSPLGRLEDLGELRVEKKRKSPSSEDASG